MKPKTFIQMVAAMVLFAGIWGACSQASNQGNEERPRVQIITGFGNLTLELYNETPEHRDNFLKLVEEGFYDGTLFHRVINGFMIQGGDPHSRDAVPGEPLGSGGPGYTIPAEIEDEFYHQKGALSAARQGDQINPERRSSGSQFYIVHGRRFSNEELDRMEQQMDREFTAEQREAYTTVGGAPHLDGGYTVFGQVISGMEIIDKIATVETGAGDRPKEDVVMEVVILD